MKELSFGRLYPGQKEVTRYFHSFWNHGKSVLPSFLRLKRIHPDRIQPQSLRQPPLHLHHRNPEPRLPKQHSKLPIRPRHATIRLIKHIAPPRIRAHILLHHNPPPLRQPPFTPPQIRNQLRIRQLAQTPLVPEQVVAMRRHPSFQPEIVYLPDLPTGTQRSKPRALRDLVCEFLDRLDDVGDAGEGGEQAECYAADAGAAVCRTGKEVGFLYVGIRRSGGVSAFSDEFGEKVRGRLKVGGGDLGEAAEHAGN